MPSAELVLVDTSVWIDYLSRRASKVDETMDALLAHGGIAAAAIIIAELVQGSHTSAEAERLRRYLQPLHWIESTDQHWNHAGQLSARLRRKGHTVNLTDCYIAALADSADAPVYTLDKHFGWIAAAGGCRLYVP